MQRELPQVGKELRASFPQDIRSIDEKTRTIEFVASTEAVDRYGDVIRVAGWKYQNYLKNPVFLWGHRSGDPPIGKCVDLKIESKPPALVQRIEFADAATYPFAETIFRLYKGGFLRAVSVGFMPTEQPMPMKDEQGFTSGYEFNGQELLELSAVPVPANTDCVARAVQKGFSDAEIARVFLAEESLASNEKIYKEIGTASLDIAELAIDLATSTVQKALAQVKALGVQPATQESVLTLEQLLKAIKIPARSDEIITSIDDLGVAFKPNEKNAEIATIDDLGDALSVESSIISRTGSRKWRDVK